MICFLSSCSYRTLIFAFKLIQYYGRKVIISQIAQTNGNINKTKIICKIFPIGSFEYF